MPARIGPKRPVRLYLAEWRESKGLTQQQLADRLETSDVTVSRWETGKRRPDDNVKAAIAWILGIEVVDLYRHPDRPTADSLLRAQPPEVQDQGIRVLEAFIASTRR